MRSSIRLFMAASVAVAGLGIVGCAESVPQRDAPGGILSGSDYSRKHAASRGQINTGADTASIGAHTSAGPGGTGGTTVSGAPADALAAPRTPAASVAGASGVAGAGGVIVAPAGS
ncbi:MAG: hypothetical protein ABIP55_15325, partial [Tepidisphaeraceae bacterium]